MGPHLAMRDMVSRAPVMNRRPAPTGDAWVPIHAGSIVLCLTRFGLDPYHHIYPPRGIYVWRRGRLIRPDRSKTGIPIALHAKLTRLIRCGGTPEHLSSQL